LKLYRVGSVDGDGGEVVDDEEDSAGQNDEGGRELCDATTKLLRLLANVGLDEEAGRLMSSRAEVFGVILELLQRLEGSAVGSCTSFDPKRGVFNEDLMPFEELLLNCISLTTNLTYYACKDGGDAVAGKHLVSIATSLSKFLFHENDDIVLESCRALGNLTRNIAVLRAFSSSRVDEALHLLLQHQHQEIISSVIGIYINATCISDSDPNPRQRLFIVRDVDSLVKTLTGVLRRLSLKCPILSCMICKVFHNIMGLSAGFSSSTAQWLTNTLEELLDCADDVSDKSSNKFADFISVGGTVLELLSNRK
jgi:hypothetical protein